MPPVNSNTLKINCIDAEIAGIERGVADNGAVHPERLVRESRKIKQVKM